MAGHTGHNSNMPHEEGESALRAFDQQLTHHSHFQYHMKHAIPVQVYERGCHVDVGVITAVDANFVEIEGTLYNRKTFTFVSRPGY